MVGLKLTRRRSVVRGRGPKSKPWGLARTSGRAGGVTEKPAREAGSKLGCVVQEARERKFSQGTGVSPRSFGSIPRSGVGEFARGGEEIAEPGRVVLQSRAGRWATGAGGGVGRAVSAAAVPTPPCIHTVE